MRKKYKYEIKNCTFQQKIITRSNILKVIYEKK